MKSAACHVAIAVAPRRAANSYGGKVGTPCLIFVLLCHLYSGGPYQFIGGLLPTPGEAKHPDPGHRHHVDEQQGWGRPRELQLKY